MYTIRNLPVIENSGPILLAASLVRAVRLERSGAPEEVLEKEYGIIKQRMGQADRIADVPEIQHAVEEVLLCRISSSFTVTSCVNCTGLFECQYTDCPESPYFSQAMLRPTLMAVTDDARQRCKEFRPDWKMYIGAGEFYTDLVNRLHTSFGLSVNRERIARHLVAAMAEWAKNHV